MSSKKLTGSYYTPEFLSGFILKYLASYFSETNNVSILEPSVGDGSFVKAFNKTDFPASIETFSFTGIDKIKIELNKAKKASKKVIKANCTYSFENVDFLEYQKNCSDKFSLIAGNPPYIKKQLLDDSQIELCDQIHQSANLSTASVKNIWSAFLVRSCQLLKDDGILAFVLPAELLQVKFSQELRTLLTMEFSRTEIFTFDDLLFDCKGQDTVLLIGYKHHITPGQYYSHIKNTEQLSTNDFLLTQNSALVDTETKWSHHLMPADDLTFIKNLGKRLHSINYYSDSKPGIVTAANDFFIVNERTEREYKLHDFTYPIIQKALYVNGSVVFTTNDFDRILSEGKQSKVLVITDRDVETLSDSVLDYIKLGENKDLQSGHKCSRRKNWYVIPNIAEAAEAFFFRRSHHYPKLIKNNARILVTDTAYKVNVKPQYDINSLIYSFYNSLSITFAELEGRYYGGGVLELTPSEFKSIPIPYIAIGNSEFEIFSEHFENKNAINDILHRNDFRVLNTALNLNMEEIQRIQRIYHQLVCKRFRKNQ
jgi:adenine-specific DNA-methyltransferase